MFKKAASTELKNQQRDFERQSNPSENTKLSVKSSQTSSLPFDSVRVKQRFREFREIQHEQLAGINLPEQLKTRLFGFSSSHYLIERVNLGDLIIENHPLNGRIIMSKQKYQIYLHQKQQEKQLRSSKGSYVTSNHKFGAFDMLSVSSLDAKREAELSQDSILLNYRTSSN